MKSFWYVIGIYYIATGSTLFGAVSLSNIFSDNMVLQRDFQTPIWGTAANGESITIKIAGQQKSTTADANGNWMVKLDPIIAGGPHTLEVIGTNTITHTNVMTGDVWFCSGQSNMAYTMTQVQNTYDANVEAVDVTDVRIVNNTSGWNEANPQTVMNFSAAGFFFGRALHKELGVPIGLIKAAAGGTNIEKWMSPAAIVKDTILDPNVSILGSLPGNLYNSQVAPLIPYGIKGVIWYQGERNSKTDLTEDTRFEYAYRMNLLIEGWREAWGQGDFPFYSVQLPDFPNATYDLPVLREQQRISMETKNSGMIVTIDIGGDLHPQNKLDVGLRLTNWAFAHDYGQYDLVFSGPLYESMEIVGNTLKLKFRHFGGGLKSATSTLQGFEIADANGTFIPATAVIDGDHVIVSSSQLSAPLNARYAWSMEPVVSLVNNDDMPASPFSTEGKQLPPGLFGCRDNSAGTFDANASIHDPLDCSALKISEKLFQLKTKVFLSGSVINIFQPNSFSLVIYNIRGNEVYRTQGIDTGRYDLNKNSAGVYQLAVKSNGVTFTSKFYLQ